MLRRPEAGAGRPTATTPHVPQSAVQQPLVLRSASPVPAPTFDSAREAIDRPTAQREQATGGPPLATVVESAHGRPSAPGARPAVQREDEEVAAAPASGAAASGAAGDAAGASGGASGQLDDRAMEDLLRRLYPKLRMQLSRELLVARERSGLLTDLH